MVFKWMKDIPSPLEALKPFSLTRRPIEAGESVDWKGLGCTARQVYKLIHDGYLEDPFKNREPESAPPKKRGRPKKKVDGAKL